MSQHATVQSAFGAGGPRPSGTPRSLGEAIERGINEIQLLAQRGESLCDADQATVIRRHVKDFLAQRFGAAMLAGDSRTTTELWNTIFPEDPRSSSS